MAEALAVIGLVSSIVQFVDFGSKVLTRLYQFSNGVVEGPDVLCDVADRLPLIIDLVKKIQFQVEHGQVDDSSQHVFLPTIQSCAFQAKVLDELLTKALPAPKDSTFKRGRKALLSIVRESEIEKIDTVLKMNFSILVQASTYHSVANLERSKSSPAQQTVNVIMQHPLRHLVRSESTPEVSPSHPHSSPLFIVPFQRDHKFIPRRAILDEMNQRLGIQRRVAIAGLGGVGKSQIAIEYCYLYKETHPSAHVFWIYAGNATRFEQTYQEIARRLSLPDWDDPKVDTLQLVCEWLSDDHSGEWLMVVDNADSAATFYTSKTLLNSQKDKSTKPLARYLPQSSLGSMIITTRDKRVGEQLAGRDKPIEVLPMIASDAEALLRSSLSQHEWSSTYATRLLEELAYLPLAITQAAAFISENCLDISEYLELLCTGDSELKELLSEHLEDPRRDYDTENSVMRTWKLSFDQISKEKPRAVQILSLMAVLDQHGVPRSLLRKTDETEIGFKTAIGALQAFSLISVGKGKNATFRMHRLVYVSTQKWLELHGMLQHWQTEALRVVLEHLPARHDYQNWSLLEALTPHSQLVLSFPFTAIDDQLQCAKVLYHDALYDLEKRSYTTALEKCHKSLGICERLLPRHHAVTLESVQALGETLIHAGQLNEARTTLERAIEGRESALGPEHPDTLESISDLAVTLLELDDLVSAEPAALRAFEGREKVLGGEHQDTLVSLNILAMLYQQQGKLDKAAEIYPRILDGREQLLGLEHTDTLMSLNNFAVLQYRLGHLQEAKQTLQQVLGGEDKLIGPESVDLQVSLSNMALILRAQGKLDAAESIHRRVLEIRERLYGSEHPSTIFSLKNIVSLLEQHGDVNAAENLRSRKASFQKRQNVPGAEGALLFSGLLYD
ncbi:hypothetical protein MMC27_007675 [Xylographa pallens]|nr:hypothetical protein [Xylographa pallens]